MLLTMSHTLLYNMTMTRCLCVEHFARFAFELKRPPRWRKETLLNPFLLLIFNMNCDKFHRDSELVYEKQEHFSKS